MKRINIMTSCDNNIAKYIFPQLVSIDENLSEYDVHFYLVHSIISSEYIDSLKDFAKNQTSINFHEIKVSKSLYLYEKLSLNGGRQWPQEAYYTLRVQDYLPDDVDRILYIDAGDVIIDGDISPYYFDAFEGNDIIATPLSFKTNPITKESELHTAEDLLKVSGGTLFNSGSYVIDVDKFRTDGYLVEDYLYLHEILSKSTNPGSMAYFGDQGFLAAAFVGRVKFFGYPQHKDPSYMPYNFRSSYWGLYKNEPNYKPIVLHYALISKPWVVRFSDEIIDSIIDAPSFAAKNLVAPIPQLAYVSPQHFKLGEIWWKYAKETPIYEEADLKATIVAESWVKYFIPLCNSYNNSMLRQLGNSKAQYNS